MYIIHIYLVPTGNLLLLAYLSTTLVLILSRLKDHLKFCLSAVDHQFKLKWNIVKIGLPVCLYP